MSSKFPVTRNQFETWLKTRHSRSKVVDNHEPILARFLRVNGKKALFTKGQVTVNGVRVTTPAWATKLVSRSKSKSVSAGAALTILSNS